MLKLFLILLNEQELTYLIRCINLRDDELMKINTIEADDESRIIRRIKDKAMNPSIMQV